MRKFSFVKPRCAVRVGDAGKRFNMLDKELETLSKLPEKYFAICRYGFSSNTQDLCGKNTANTVQLTKRMTFSGVS